MVATHRREIGTRGQGDSHDITDLVAHAVTQSKCDAGIATVFVVGSTAGVTTIEYEPGAVQPLLRTSGSARGGVSAPSSVGRRQRIEPRARGVAGAVVDRAVCGGEAGAWNLAADHAARIRHTAAAPRSRHPGGRRVRARS